MTSEILNVPYNLEAEQSVIGGLLLGDDSSERVQKVLAMLKPESFYIRVHQIIFAEIRQMFRDNKPVDGLTLFDSLESKGLIEQIGGFAYIAQRAVLLSGSVHSSGRWISAITIVSERLIC